MFDFFIPLIVFTLSITLVLYVPFLLLRKIKFKIFVKDYLCINLFFVFTYFCIFKFKTRFLKFPINLISWLDVIIPSLFILFLVLILKFIFKTNNIQKKKIITYLSFFFIIWLLLFCTDYYRCSKNSLPIFCTSFNSLFTYQDGGTTIYFGLGYKVFNFNTPNLKCKYICSLLTTYNQAYDNAIKKLTDI